MKKPTLRSTTTKDGITLFIFGTNGKATIFVLNTPNRGMLAATSYKEKCKVKQYMNGTLQGVDDVQGIPAMQSEAAYVDFAIKAQVLAQRVSNMLQIR